MKDESEIARNNEFIKEFKQLCKRYGYVDHLMLKGVEQDINIKLQSRLKEGGFINTGINKNKDGVRHKLKVIGKLETIIPPDSPEDRYQIINIEVEIKRIEEQVNLLNRKQYRDNHNKINTKEVIDDFEHFLPLNPDPYAKY